jgi:hypothetical protein
MKKQKRNSQKNHDSSIFEYEKVSKKRKTEDGDEEVEEVKEKKTKDKLEIQRVPTFQIFKETMKDYIQKKYKNNIFGQKIKEEKWKLLFLKFKEWIGKDKNGKFLIKESINDKDTDKKAQKILDFKLKCEDYQEKFFSETKTIFKEFEEELKKYKQDKINIDTYDKKNYNNYKEDSNKKIELYHDSFLNIEEDNNSELATEISNIPHLFETDDSSQIEIEQPMKNQIQKDDSEIILLKSNLEDFKNLEKKMKKEIENFKEREKENNETINKLKNKIKELKEEKEDWKTLAEYSDIHNTEDDIDDFVLLQELMQNLFTIPKNFWSKTKEHFDEAEKTGNFEILEIMNQNLKEKKTLLENYYTPLSNICSQLDKLILMKKETYLKKKEQLELETIEKEEKSKNELLSLIQNK